MFEKSFDLSHQPEQREPATEAAPEPPKIHIEPLPPLPSPTYNEAQLQSACAAARAEGEATSRAELMASMAQQQLQLLETVSRQIPAATAELQADFARFGAEVARVAVALMAKILPAYARGQGAAEVTEFVRQTIDYALGRPRLRIQLHPETQALLGGILQEEAQKHGFTGKVELLTDPNLGLADVVMDWGDGSSERLERRIWQAIEQMIPPTIAPKNPKPENKSDGP